MSDNKEPLPEYLDALTKERLSRRAFLKKAGVAGLAAGSIISFPTFAAACGNGESETTTTAEPDTTTTTAGGESSTTTTAGTGTGGLPTTGLTFEQMFPGGADAGQGVTLSDGMCLAVTGQGSFFGRVMSQGAQSAAKVIKDQLSGPEFKISIADHQSGLVEAGVTAVRRLVTQEGIKTLQTSYGAVSEGLIPLIKSSKLLSFNGGGSTPGQLSQQYLWMNRMLFAYDPTDGGLAWLAKNHPDLKKLAVVGTNETGVEVWQEGGKAPRIWPLLQDGGTIVATEIHEVGATDFSSVVARCKSAGAQAVFTVSFGDDLGYLVKQFREANWDGPIMGIEFTQQAQKIAGALYDTYNFAVDYFDASSTNPFTAAGVKAIAADYEGDVLEYYGANYWEQVFVIWECMRRVIKSGGDVQDGAALDAALQSNPEFYSMFGGGGDNAEAGTMKFDLNDHSISKPMAVFGVKDGNPYPIQPIQKIGLNDDPTTSLL